MKKKNVRIIKFGYYILALGFLFLSIKLLPNIILKFVKDKQPEVSNNPQETQKEDVLGWTIYVNEDYFLTFFYPKFLNKREYEETGEYEFFIVFEENKFSSGKGVAFSVTKDNLEKEIERIKKTINLQSEPELVKDEELNDWGERSRLIIFEAKEEGFENRAFIVIQKGSFTYSFSTVPEQIEKLRRSITFLK